MALTPNGYTVKAGSAGLLNDVIPGTNVRLAPGVENSPGGQMLRLFAELFHQRVEPLRAGWCWGYAKRTNRNNAAVVSEHGAATAIDLNAPAHPNGKVGTFTAAELAALRGLLRLFRGAIEWGGDFSRTKDEQHFQLARGIDGVGILRAVLADLGRGPAAPVQSTPSIATCPGVTREGMRNSSVTRAYQSRLQQKGWSISVDGDHGASTTAALKRFQAAKGLTADGVGGLATWRALWA